MIETDRLILRPWREADIGPFHAMGQDAEVMRYLGPPVTEDEARRTYERVSACQAEHGICFWAIERRGDGVFLGFCGLKPGAPVLADPIEIGWRLRREAWGQGYAREAAAASIAWGWANLDVPTITAITVIANTRSWGLMERLGMTRYPDEDFDHPNVPDGNPLKRHILYRIARP
ncbi:MAG: GNAT family N-acetyltransferase [Sphingomonas sp.]|uniref:GNAT family N-acetyltransferase n=1 Tax=Sphingomonas sp. TaxID=28214 RepID=UPI001ACE53DE|nr:GNAT family N-acetyltransferase [Sphingomonas sp.]MBN8807290.1 GNAT family N-acetyltransferase [Sphingomonas sp.]